MKKIFKASVLAFMVAFMFTACAGSDDNARPVFRELFDTYDPSITFPAGTQWSYYTRTSDVTWTYITGTDVTTIPDNWSIGYNGADYAAQLSVPASAVQSSAFITPNYNTTDVDSSVSVRMVITSNGPDNNSVEGGVILRATGNGSEHYAFVYLGMQVGSDPLNPLNLAPTIEIQKVNAAGTITPLGSASVAGYVSSGGFDPTAGHTYRLGVSGTTILTFTAYIDGTQQLPAIYDANGNAVTPANPPITDSGVGGYHLGNPGFFVENVNYAWVTRVFMWEP
jgi:hypothetical protein